jgi:hypothetical protein
LKKRRKVHKIWRLDKEKEPSTVQKPRCGEEAGLWEIASFERDSENKSREDKKTKVGKD